MPGPTPPSRARRPGLASPAVAGRLAGAWLVCAVALAGTRPAHAGEGERRRAEPPADNVSHVPADDPVARRAFLAVTEAMTRGQVAEAARALQAAATLDKGLLWPVSSDREGGVFESVATVAHHRVLSMGAAVFAAYEREFGPRAGALLEDAVARRDEGALATAFDRYAPTEAGRRAALLLAVLATERGDADAALGVLERLEDLEDAAAPDVAPRLAPSREARRRLVARTLAATPEAEARILTRLSRLTPGEDVIGGEGVEAVTSADVVAPPRPSSWPTSGGGPARTGASQPVPGDLVLSAFEEFTVPEHPPLGEVEARGRAQRPSPWIPPRAVVAGDRVVVHDGRRLHLLSLATFKLTTRAPFPLLPDEPAAPPGRRGVPARRAFGLIEGFGLTIQRDVGAHEGTDRGDRGDTVFAHVPAEIGDGSALVQPPDARAWRDRVVAVRLTPSGPRRLWVAGGPGLPPGLPEGMRLCGAPLLYAGALHVVGQRGADAAADLLEAWHVALDPATGALRSAVLLGTGRPLRRKRADEAMPAPCAGARGRVYVVTSLGIAAAVDARSGRTLWAYRYDRGRPDGDDEGRRLVDDLEAADRRSSFFNAPPRALGSDVVFAPTDSRHVFCVRGRPSGPARQMTRWKLHRTEDTRNLAIEHVAAVTEATRSRPALVVAVGQGYGVDPLHDPFTCVVAIDARSGRVRWERALPFGGVPEPFGEAAVAGDDVFVPTAHGIARYALDDGADGPPVLVRERLGDVEVFGNVVPVAGEGLLCVAPALVVRFTRAPAGEAGR